MKSFHTSPRKLSSALTLLLLTALILNSCGGAEAPISTDTTASDTETEAVTGRAAISDDLGEYDFGGYEFRIVTSDGMTGHYFMEESTGDVVDDAIYNRNRAVEERFNCKISVVSDTAYNEKAIITNSVSAMDDSIDLICWHVVGLGGMVTEDFFMNWYDIDKVNFDKPWWSSSNTEHLTYNGYCPIAIGDFILSAVERAYCVFYNKTAGLDYNIPDMYEVVNNGEWTFDYLMNTTKDISVDLNGDSTIDENDFVGFVSDCHSNVDAYLWAFGNNIIGKDSEGKLGLQLDLEKSAAVVDKLYNAFSSNTGMELGKIGVWHHGMFKFIDGNTLFANGLIGHSLDLLRDVEDDYAILPYPKWDENQKDYYTMVDGSHQVMAVPVTVTDTEKIGVIVEALCAESYKTVVPAYYDVALKFKGTRDDESIEMLDRIVNSRVFDFGYIFDNWLGASFIMEQLLTQSKPNFASYWAARESQITEHYTEIIEYFEKSAK